MANPWEAAAILPKKLMHLYLLEMEVVTVSVPGQASLAGMDEVRALRGEPQLTYVCVLILFCTRALELLTPAHRPRAEQWTGWLFVGYFTLLCLVFHGQDRYRLPILPWILIEGSVVLARAAGGRVREGARKGVSAAGQ